MAAECSSGEPSSSVHPILREYPLQSNLLQQIPAKAQKALSTFDIEFTCVDADGHYIVIGSNVGIVYLFDRIRNSLCRLRNDQKDAITCVKVLISLECLVVFGCKNGAVTLFKVPFNAEEATEKFIVEGFHSSSITALEWSKNGMKFFSGDENGVVVCTEVDHFEHQSRSRVLLNEPSKIVQLSYSRKHLVVSTLFRSIVYSCEDKSITKIGQKERKCFGPFGALIFHTKSAPNGTIFASRPGQRLWKSDQSGVIHETMIFKNTLLETHPTMTLLSGQPSGSFCDFQFGQLSRFNEKYILVSSDSALLLVDPELKSIVASCPKLDPIVFVCASNEEIFVLRGLRHLIRISSNPDPYPCEKVSDEPSLMEEILVPFKGISTFVKERSDSLAAQTENSTLFGWLKKSRSSSTPTVMPSDYNENENTITQVLPDVVKLESSDCTPVVLDNTSSEYDNEVPKIEITVPILENENDDIVYKPKKKPKKKVRFRSVSPRKSDRKPLPPSQESNNKPQTDSIDTKPISNEPIINGTNDTNSNDCVSIDVTDSIIKTDSSKVTDLPNFTNGELTDMNSNSNEITPLSKDNVDADLSNTYNDKIQDTEPNINNLNLDNNSKKEYNTETDENSNSNEITTEGDVYDIEDIYSLSDSQRTNPTDLMPPETESHSSEVSSNTSTETFEYEPPKYGVNWIEYKAPELLIDLCISNDHIFYVDVKNQLSFSDYPKLGLLLRALDQPAEKIAVSQSESVAWALHKGVVYAALQKSEVMWKEVEWLSIARDVASVAVDDTSGWYITTSGHLNMMPGLTLSRPYSYPEPVACGSAILQISARDGVVWVLAANGLLYSVDHKDKKSKMFVKEILLNAVPDIDSIFLGVHQTGWVIDCNGTMHFVIGITSKTPGGMGKPWKVEDSSYFVRQMIKLPKAVQKAINKEKLTAFFRGKQQVCLSTSPHGIWFCKTFDNLVYSNQKTIIGHQWDTVVPPGTTSTTKWRLISAAGVLSSQGCVWCFNHSNELFCLNVSSNILETVELPSVNAVRSLVPTTQSLWLLGDQGEVFVRRGMTPNSLGGNRWQALDLSQLGSEKITFISCSYEVVWACTDSGRVLIRLGTLCPADSRKLPQAWIPISIDKDEGDTGLLLFYKLSAFGKKFPLPLMPQSNPDVFLCKVYVGPLGHPVWALDTNCNVYVREGVSNTFPIGKKWILVPELRAKELCISRSAVWLLKMSGKIFRRFGVSEKNPCGDYWKQIPGNMDCLSVTEEDDLWGLKEDSMFTHFSYVLDIMPNEEKKLPARSISEDDWEDIMAETSDSEF